MDKAQEYEARLDLEGLMARALEGLKITEISAETAKDKQEDEFADFYKNKYSDGRLDVTVFIVLISQTSCSERGTVIN